MQVSPMASLYIFCPTISEDLHESSQEMDSLAQGLNSLQAAAAATGALRTLWLQVLDIDFYTLTSSLLQTYHLFSAHCWHLGSLSCPAGKPVV